MTLSFTSFLSLLFLFSFFFTLFPLLVISDTTGALTQGSYTLFGRTNAEVKFTHCLDGSGSGNIFAVGTTDGRDLGQDQSISGGYDMFILKYSKTNGFLSSSTNNPTMRFITTPKDDIGETCDSDVNGAVYVGGTTTGTLTTSIPYNTNNYYESVVAKYDAAMNLVWLTQFTANYAFDGVLKVILFGSLLYAFGITQNSYLNGIYFQAFDAGSGNRVGPLTNYVGTDQVYMSGATIDVLGIHTADLVSVSNNDGFIASFDSFGNPQWQIQVGTTGYDVVSSVATDLSGFIYVGGYVQGTLYGQSFTPGYSNNVQCYWAKYSNTGLNVWFHIVPQSDNSYIKSMLVDNIGGLFLLRAGTACYSTFSITGRPSDYNCPNTDSLSFNFIKGDINSAVAYELLPTSTGFTGIIQGFTIDNTGLLTMSGSMYGSATLHGLSPTNGNWDGFIDQQLINYNCSCGNLASLVTQMSNLLNIIPS